MATSRRQYRRPAKVVEIKPSNIAPSSPPSSPKAVHFAPSTSGLVTGVSRELTPTEAWSLYYFEKHAWECATCYNPLAVFHRGGQLCEAGHALALDVALHVYHKSGEIYSTTKENHKLVRVEFPPGRDQVRGLLKGMEHRLRQTSRPVISYDRSYPISPRRSSHEREAEHTEGRREVIIEPADSRRRKEQKGSGSRSKQKSTRYKTTVVQDNVEAGPVKSPEPKPRERRGSLYYEDKQRKEKSYHVETREPKWERQKDDGRRRSGFYA